MDPSTECRKLALLLREKAMVMEDAALKAEYAYLVRGLSAAREAIRTGQGNEASRAYSQQEHLHFEIFLIFLVIICAARAS